jgi:hypothetical protein
MQRTIALVLDSFLFEFQIFEKIIYKNKNQHRRGIYFRKLMEVRKYGRLLSLSLPSFSDENFQLNFLQDTILSLWRMLGSCLQCSRLLLDLLSQSYFMTMTLALIGCISRFYACLRPVLLASVKLLRQHAAAQSSQLDQIELFLSSGPVSVEYATLTSQLNFNSVSQNASDESSLFRPSLHSEVSDELNPLAATTVYDSDNESEEMNSADREALLRIKLSNELIDATSKLVEGGLESFFPQNENIIETHKIKDNQEDDIQSNQLERVQHKIGSNLTSIAFDNTVAAIEFDDPSTTNTSVLSSITRSCADSVVSHFIFKEDANSAQVECANSEFPQALQSTLALDPVASYFQISESAQPMLLASTSNSRRTSAKVTISKSRNKRNSLVKPKRKQNQLYPFSRAHTLSTHLLLAFSLGRKLRRLS